MSTAPSSPSPSKSEKTSLDIELHNKQFEAFGFGTQFCLAVAGVRGGKTFVGAIWTGNKIANTEGDGLITAPDWQTLRDATLSTFFKIFPGYLKYYKEQKHTIQLPGGKKVYLRSMDDPLSAEGLTVNWIWADEAGKYKLLAWHSLRSRVSLTKGQIFLTTTPYNMGWLYQDFYKPWEDNLDKDLSVVSWASIDNPYFPKEVYEAEMKRLSGAEFKRRYMGVFTRMQGLVYNLHTYHIVEPKELKADIVLGGVDWGWTNPAAITIIVLSQGAYYLVDEWYMTGKTTQQIIEEMIKMQNKWRVNRWYADSANPEKVAEANTNTGLNVVPYEKKKDSINAGVLSINQLMLENRLFVFRGLKDTLAEFESYQYPEPNEKGIVAKEEPMPFNNHLMDAMRYAIMGYQPAMRYKVPTNETYTQLNVRRMLGSQEYANRGNDDYV